MHKEHTQLYHSPFLPNSHILSWSKGTVPALQAQKGSTLTNTAFHVGVCVTCHVLHHHDRLLVADTCAQELQSSTPH